MSSQTGAGSSIAISATLPTTYDATGYNALAMTEIGEITNIGGDLGRNYSKVEHKPLKTRATQKRKGGYDAGSGQLTFARDAADAGQILLKTASNSDANYSFRITRQDGSKKYFIGQVFGFAESIGDNDSINSVTSTVEVNASPAGVDYVEVP